MLDIAIALQAGCLAMSVGKFSGIIKDKLSLKIDHLASSEFEAGLRALEQAATSEREQEYLLREARARFNQAISLEKDYRLAASFLGLALCHVNLGDAVNAAQAIVQMIEVQPSVRPLVPLVQQANRWCHKFVLSPIALPGAMHVAAFACATTQVIEAKQLSKDFATNLPLRELQAEGLSFLERSLNEEIHAVFGLSNTRTTCG